MNSQNERGHECQNKSKKKTPDQINDQLNKETKGGTGEKWQRSQGLDSNGIMPP